MPETAEGIHVRIKSIRISKQQSIHNCAAILGVSAEAYHNKENGAEPISLPELELLAAYLDIDLSDFLSEKPKDKESPVFLDENLRPQYLRIRDKMLWALITFEQEKQALSLEDIQNATHIPVEALDLYNRGEVPVPIVDLIKISDFLGISTDKLLETFGENELKSVNSNNFEDWQPEYPSSSVAQTDNGDTFIDIIEAFRKISKQDQALIAKYLLEKLKSM